MCYILHASIVQTYALDKDMKKKTNINETFRIFAQKTSNAAGSSWAFLIAFLTVIIWAISGPIFHFSETWQLVINTGTTIITFLMVFLVQNTQNRDAKAVHIKLDELILVQRRAKNKLIGAEEQSDIQMQKEEKEIKKKEKKRKSK
jgi:low affinity Fe/Cu permease